MKPKLSIISSVFNGQEHLEKSIKSVLEQTFKDFEFLIIDDKSTDETLECLKKYNDPRIKIFENQKNIGLTKSLNKLIDVSNGEIIARIDLDDFCERDRFEKQINFLDQNKDFGMVTSCYKAVDQNEKELYSHCPCLDPILLKWSLIFRNNIRHSTVMWRKELDEKYNEDFKYAQDYEMWSKIARKTKIGVLPDITTNIMCHNKAITSIFFKQQEESANMVTQEQYFFYTNKQITIEQSNEIRLFYFLKDAKQFEEFEKIPNFKLKNAINNYLNLLVCFLEKEKISLSHLESEVDNDLRSIFQRNDKKSKVLIIAINDFFLNNKNKEKELQFVKQKYNYNCNSVKMHN